MRWTGRRQSRNVEDRRAAVSGPMLTGGGIVVVLVLALVFGVDPTLLLEGVQNGGPPQQSDSGAVPDPAQDELAQFVSVVLADTEDTWHDVFAAKGGTYREPTLVLFSGTVRSACGMAQSAMGPFYCPADERVYIDLAFYRELRERFHAPGDFAQAYVIAHEVGHHVQNLLGISDQVDAARRSLSGVEANALSVRVELQADCLAGVWANRADAAKQILEQGDLEEALNAASAVGDDRLQRESQGYVVPDSFTHGSAAQRATWFRRGFNRGEMTDCDTFAAGSL
jgi:uncharacterized protein